MNGIFTISLDFELHWGGFEKWPLADSGFRVPGSRYTFPPATYNQYFLNTRVIIPKMLALFEQHSAHVTWAGVGMLMHKDKDSLVNNFPALRPTYKHDELSAYSFIDNYGIGNNEEEDPFHYADSLVKMIRNTKNQELGSHSFSHYYCNEEGQTVDQFRADLQAAQKAAAAYGVTLRSLVFPRNQFNDAYLKICWEEGFDSVRSNPLDWFWHIDSALDESFWKRLNRGVDAYFPLGKQNTYALQSIKFRKGFPICLPASRLLRPYRPSEWILNDLKIKRIEREMIKAARTKEVYHLWWHPHNFGNHDHGNMEGLERILACFDHCKKEYGMKGMTMGEITDVVKKNNGQEKTA